MENRLFDEQGGSKWELRRLGTVRITWNFEFRNSKGDHSRDSFKATIPYGQVYPTIPWYLISNDKIALKGRRGDMSDARLYPRILVYRREKNRSVVPNRVSPGHWDRNRMKKTNQYYNEMRRPMKRKNKMLENGKKTQRMKRKPKY